MADKFNLDGFSVDEDNVCTAEGGFVGQNFGDATTYTVSATAPTTDKVVIINTSLDVVNVTIPDGTPGQELYVYAINVENTCSIGIDMVGGGTSILYDAVAESSILVYSSDGWVPVFNSGTLF
jgi:hypothetical protein